ncbi:MAG: threonine--tRNA ligase, partial [Calditrichaeota bacterium]|nr:threonine--tRNA ligase [Calditrichota bacterium]
QIQLIPIADRHLDFCNELQAYFKQNGIRVEIDDRREKLGFKIRESELMKIPYMIVIGDTEEETKQLAVRHKSEGDIGSFGKEDLLKRMKIEIENKTIIN